MRLVLAMVVVAMELGLRFGFMPRLLLLLLLFVLDKARLGLMLGLLMLVLVLTSGISSSSRWPRRPRGWVHGERS